MVLEEECGGSMLYATDKLSKGIESPEVKRINYSQETLSSGQRMTLKIIKVALFQIIISNSELLL